MSLLVRSNTPSLPDPMRSNQRRNPDELDILPLYTKLPGAGETTVDISPLEQGEILPEYSEVGKDDEGKSRG